MFTRFAADELAQLEFAAAVGRRDELPRRRARRAGGDRLGRRGAASSVPAGMPIISRSMCPFGMFFGRLANFVERRAVGPGDRCALGDGVPDRPAGPAAIPRSFTRRRSKARC